MARERIFVLVITAVLYSLSAVVFALSSTDYVVGIAVLGSLGTIYLAIFLFGSDRLCEIATFIPASL
jgi:hypothetical protein